MTFDVIIRNGRWFDGTGAPSAVRNLGIRDGRVAAVTPEDLDETGCPTVIDAWPPGRATYCQDARQHEPRLAEALRQAQRRR